MRRSGNDSFHSSPRPVCLRSRPSHAHPWKEPVQQPQSVAPTVHGTTTAETRGGFPRPWAGDPQKGWACAPGTMSAASLCSGHRSADRARCLGPVRLRPCGHPASGEAAGVGQPERPGPPVLCPCWAVLRTWREDTGGSSHSPGRQEGLGRSGSVCRPSGEPRCLLVMHSHGASVMGPRVTGLRVQGQVPPPVSSFFYQELVCHAGDFRSGPREAV